MEPVDALALMFDNYVKDMIGLDVKGAPRFFLHHRPNSSEGYDALRKLKLEEVQPAFDKFMQVKLTYVARRKKNNVCRYYRHTYFLAEWLYNQGRGLNRAWSQEVKDAVVERILSICAEELPDMAGCVDSSKACLSACSTALGKFLVTCLAGLKNGEMGERINNEIKSHEVFNCFLWGTYVNISEDTNHCEHEVLSLIATGDMSSSDGLSYNHYRILVDALQPLPHLDRPDDRHIDKHPFCVSVVLTNTEFAATYAWERPYLVDFEQNWNVEEMVPLSDEEQKAQLSLTAASVGKSIEVPTHIEWGVTSKGINSTHKPLYHVVLDHIVFTTMCYGT